jgi:2-oxoisovalerate ferredoxin oxidoreductase alpha subunit
MIEPLKFPEEALAPATDTSWAVDGTAATRKNCITSIFLNFDELEAFNVKLQEKYARVEAEEQRSETYRLEDADIGIVAYGIVARIAHGVVDAARAEGIKAGLFRPKTLYPFPKDALKAFVAGGGKRLLSAEMSNGQMRDDIKLAIDCACPVELVNRLGGNLITHEQILAKVREMAKA